MLASTAEQYAHNRGVNAGQSSDWKQYVRRPTRPLLQLNISSRFTYIYGRHTYIYLHRTPHTYIQTRIHYTHYIFPQIL